MIVIYPLANDQRHHARIVIRYFTDTLAHDFCPQTLVSASLLELFVFAQADFHRIFHFLTGLRLLLYSFHRLGATC